MSTPNEPAGGCLAVLSSCFKGRSKTQPEDLQFPRPTQSVTTANHPLTPGLGAAQQRASTPALTGNSIPQPAKTDGLPSAITGNEPTFSVSISDQIPLPTKPASTQLDLWQEAYNAVEENTKKWINENIGEWTENTNPFAELVDLVRSSEEKHDKEAWKIELGSRAILLREYTNKVSSCLTAIGDIVINFAPAPSPIIWNAVKVLLKGNVSQCEDLVSIMGCTDMVLCLARRGIVYEEVYLHDIPLSPAQDDLKRKVIGVYKTCLEFLAFVHQELKQGNLRRLLEALLDPGHGEQHVSDVKAVEQELENTARACEAIANLTRSNQHRELLKSLQLPLKRIDNAVTDILASLDVTEKTKVLEYISTIQVGNHHNEKCKTRTEGTCEWLVGHTKFREWEESSCSSIFWLQGSMGTGKSYLSSKVIDRYLVRGHREDLNSQHDEGFGFFYCYRSDPSRRNTESIIRSYIRQLSDVPRRPGSVHKASLDLYKESRNIQHDLTLTKCKDTLAELINSYPRVTLVLDALDECGDETKQELAILFQNLVNTSKRLLKVFIASRKEIGIEKCFESFQSHPTLVSISTFDNAGDIERFIAHEMKEVAPQWGPITEETKLLVKDTLVKKSGGMFRWVYLQWQYLKRCHMSMEVRQRLEKLPKTLSAAYDEIYDRFEPGDFQRALLQRTIRWVLHATRPLNSVTLLAVIRAESKEIDGDRAFDESDLTEPILELICQDLVVRDSGIWKFPHASVAEYFLLRREPWIRNAKSEITISLIKFLIDCCAAFPSVWPPPEIKKTWEDRRSSKYDVYRWFQSEGVSLEEHLDPRHPLQTYTQQEWLKHIDNTSEQDPKFEDVVQVLKLFLGEKGPQEPSAEYMVFCDYLMPGQFDQYHRVKDDVQPSENSTFGIITMGLFRLLPSWWDQNLDPSKLNASGQDLLAIAAKFGHISICEDLVGRNFDINREVDHVLQSALGMAIECRHIEITRFLLKNGANPHLVTQRQSLLCLAARANIKSLQAMLDAGADPNIHCRGDCLWGCALSAAAYRGDIAGVEALIKAGAAVNPTFLGLRHRSPLANTVLAGVDQQYGNQDSYYCCASLLLEHGADASAPMKNRYSWERYSSMLEAAVKTDHVALARLLVEYGADIETPLELQRYNTILEYAVEKGDVDFAQFLISHGADVHSRMKFGKYGSILAAATLAPDSSLDMVRFLIEEARVDLAQLRWQPPPAVELNSFTFLGFNPSLFQITGAEERTMEQDKSRAERERYLIDEQGVDPQILKDIQLY